MGVLGRVEIVDGQRQFWEVNVGNPIVTSGDFVAYYRDGWRRGCSQITLGFLVFITPLR